MNSLFLAVDRGGAEILDSKKSPPPKRGRIKKTPRKFEAFYDEIGESFAENYHERFTKNYRKKLSHKFRGK